MATNFSHCKGSYVLNQSPSNVMFGMNGFHVSASGAIQGHHGPLVFYCLLVLSVLERLKFLSADEGLSTMHGCWFTTPYRVTKMKILMMFFNLSGN